MALLNLKPWLLRAQREQSAVGAFNANTLEQLQAIVIAAAEEQAPIIIQVSHHALQYIGNGNSFSVFYVSEDSEAKQVAEQLIRDAGFDPVDAGPLANA